MVLIKKFKIITDRYKNTQKQLGLMLNLFAVTIAGRELCGSFERGLISGLLNKVRVLDGVRNFFMKLPNFDFKDICTALKNLKEVNENIDYLTYAIESIQSIYNGNPEKIQELGVNGALFYAIWRNAIQELNNLTNNDLSLYLYVDFEKGGADAFFRRYSKETDDKNFELKTKQYLKGKKIPKKLKFVLDRVGISLS